LQQGISQPVFYGDLIYKLKKIQGNANFSKLFVKTICKFKTKGYQHDILQRSACLVTNPSTVDPYPYLFGLRVYEGLWGNLIQENL
jgi:hypothetical protein